MIVRKFVDGRVQMVVIDEPPVDIHLFPLEAHIGGPGFRRDLFEAIVKQVKESEDRRLVLMGDNIEAATKDSIGDVFEQKLSPEEQVEKMAEAFAPISNKIWAMIAGNHEGRIKRNTSIDVAKLVAWHLGIPYFEGGQGVIRARIGAATDRKHYVIYTIHIAHGRSSSRTPGGRINAADRMAQVVASVDLYIYGHTHGIEASRQRRFEVVGDKMVERIYRVVTAGSLLDYANYAKESVRRPLPLGSPEIILKAKTKDLRVII